MPPSYYGSLYGQPSEATLAAQQAAEKAASGATTKIAPRVVLTPEQRQANMARDLTLSQMRGVRPSGQDSQFYQPVYQSQYQNYATTNPLGVSQYGMGGGNTLTPELERSLMQRAMTTGLPKSESDKYGGYAAISALYDSYGGTRDTVGQQVSTHPLQFNPYTNRGSYSAGAPQMQTPFSYQQPAAQPQTPFSYQQPAAQPQTPFSYQQPASQANSGFNYSAPMQLPQYVYDTIRDIDSYKSQPVQAYQSTRPAPVTSSGPSKAIVGRSSQMRGTPNVMAAPVAKAKGGIASLLKKHK
jgi:hypothetical protein